MCKNHKQFLRLDLRFLFILKFFMRYRLITLIGPRNKTTPRLPLKNNDKNLFEKGKTNVFKVNTNYVGPIQKVRIEHDNTGASPGCKLK
jgi:hypothetical protein